MEMVGVSRGQKSRHPRQVPISRVTGKVATSTRAGNSYAPNRISNGQQHHRKD
jgi:hypothetical protein